MTLLPLKKKLSRFMQWFGLGSAVAVGAAAFCAGPAGLTVYERHGGPDEAREKAALQEKVTRLVADYKISQNMHMLMQTAGGPDVGVVVDFQRAAARDKSLKDAFEAEAENTGIALAHARQISSNDRDGLYGQLEGIQPKPDYLRTPSSLTFRHAQSQVMDRPGFTPSLETAREIVSHADHRMSLALGCLFGPFLISLAGIFGFYAVGKRLDLSVKNDAQAEKDAEAARLAAEAERVAGESAERERVAQLPVAVATALEKDISVRQIRLAAKDRTPER